MDTLAVHCSHYGLCPDYIYYNLEVLQMVEVTRSNSLSLSLSLSLRVCVRAMATSSLLSAVTRRLVTHSCLFNFILNFQLSLFMFMSLIQDIAKAIMIS